MGRLYRSRVASSLAGAVLVLAVHAVGGPPDATRSTRGVGPAYEGTPDAAAAAVGPPGAALVPPTLDAIERMCGLLAGCPELPVPSTTVPAASLSACVRTMLEEFARPTVLELSLTVRECGLEARSCEEFRNCALRGAAVDACVGRGRSGPAALCDADGRALTCLHERVVSVRDCPRGGEQCAVREGVAVCALGPCAVESKALPSCSASGTRVLRCDRGKLVSVDCGALGLRCVDTDGGAACAPSSAPCTTESRHCEGNVAVGCLHGREVRIDCGAMGWACGGTGPSAGSCTAPHAHEPSCDSVKSGRCDGGIVRYCAAGKPRSVACRSLGFERCISSPKGARCSS